MEAKKIIKVLFVCLGNICRSPMAEGIFQHKVRYLHKPFDVSSDSAGTAAYHLGEDPDPRTMNTLKNHGIAFKHAARQAKTEDADTFDFILAMDQQNFADLKEILPDTYEGLFKMRDFDILKRGADVPDPYYGGNDGFEKVYEMLNRSIDHFIEEKLK